MRKPQLVLTLVTGAVTLAGVAAAVPAHAGGRTPSPGASSSRPQVAPSRAPGATSGAASSSTVVAPAVTSSPVTPDYGGTKIRVGVQVSDGSYVPDGTSTLGSEVQIVESGCGLAGTCEGELATVVGEARAHGLSVATPHGTATSETSTCTTTVTAAESGTSRQAHAGTTGPDSATYCEFAGEGIDARRANLAPSGSEYYYALPGDTVTLTQLTIPKGQAIERDTETITIPPCTQGFACFSDGGDEANPATVAAAQFNDPGLAPSAVADSASVRSGDSADILVLDNDDSHGAPTSITHVGAPAHGTVAVEGTGSYTAPAPRARRANAANGSQSIVYTPKAGFVGTDHFPYTITTANGTSTALVTVTVTAPPPTAVNDTAKTTSGGAVTIPVTDNDSSHGGGTLVISGVSDPSHGSAAVKGEDIVYTPAAGFSGTDTFTYTVKTAYGTATATVTVTVDPAAVPVPTGTSLPFTGLDATGLGALGAGLLLAGGGARLVGRRRPTSGRQHRTGRSPRGRH